MALQTVPVLASSNATIASMLPIATRPVLLPWLLSVGNDSGLLASRAELFKRAGCRVRSCSSRSVRELIRRGSYAAVILGHSLADSETLELARAVRELSPYSKLLLMKNSTLPSEDTSTCSMPHSCVQRARVRWSKRFGSSCADPGNQ